VVAILNAPQKVNPTKMESPKVLGLPQDLESEMEAIIHKNRMMWEVWAESASSYQEFRKAVASRGYKQIPMSPASIMNLKKIMEAPSIKTDKLPHQKTMIRKGR